MEVYNFSYFFFLQNEQFDHFLRKISSFNGPVIIVWPLFVDSAGSKHQSVKLRASVEWVGFAAFHSLVIRQNVIDVAWNGFLCSHSCSTSLYSLYICCVTIIRSNASRFIFFGTLKLLMISNHWLLCIENRWLFPKRHKIFSTRMIFDF